MSALDHAVLLALLLGACATTQPQEEKGLLEPTRDEALKSWGPHRDALGRLVTGPGLCRIEEASKTTSSPSADVTLELRYDGLGRPVEATTRFAPHCPSGASGEGEWDPTGDDCGTLDCPARKCRTHERHVQRWTWDERGRLVEGERLVVAGIEPVDWRDPELEVSEDPRCQLDHQLVRETKRWSYDEADRLATYASTHSDCEVTRVREERLSYPDGGDQVVEVVVNESPDPSGERHWSLRHHLDDSGRVIAIEPSSRFTYDEFGRLLHALHGYGEQQWTYQAGIVGSPGSQSWLVEVSRGSRALRLVNDSGGDEHVYEFLFDERQRVIAVEADHTAWTLSYDDCPNAALAQARWRLDEILFPGVWPFPTPPQPGDGATALDKWLHGKLPLTPQM